MKNNKKNISDGSFESDKAIQSKDEIKQNTEKLKGLWEKCDSIWTTVTMYESQLKESTKKINQLCSKQNVECLRAFGKTLEKKDSALKDKYLQAVDMYHKELAKFIPSANHHGYSGKNELIRKREDHIWNSLIKNLKIEKKAREKYDELIDVEKITPDHLKSAWSECEDTWNNLDKILSTNKATADMLNQSCDDYKDHEVLFTEHAFLSERQSRFLTELKYAQEKYEYTLDRYKKLAGKFSNADNDEIINTRNIQSFNSLHDSFKTFSIAQQKVNEILNPWMLGCTASDFSTI
ncbi:MAG: hypothetical protein WCR55_11935 [Lentisphaerota bacterium]